MSARHVKWSHLKPWKRTLGWKFAIPNVASNISLYEMCSMFTPLLNSANLYAPKSNATIHVTCVIHMWISGVTFANKHSTTMSSNHFSITTHHKIIIFHPSLLRYTTINKLGLGSLSKLLLMRSRYYRAESIIISQNAGSFWMIFVMEQVILYLWYSHDR